MLEMPNRPTLGGYTSLICFQYLRLGTEDVAGRAPIIASGRQRGYDVVEQLGLLGATHDPNVMQTHLANVFGVDGTRLCLVQKVSAKPNGGFEVHLTEGACTAGQVSSEPLCAFTLGAFIGAISGMTGERMRGTETKCCACGDDECVYHIDPIE